MNPAQDVNISLSHCEENTVFTTLTGCAEYSAACPALTPALWNM